MKTTDPLITELSWAAGVVDSSVSIYTHGKLRPAMRVARSDKKNTPAVLTRMQMTVGGTIYGPYKRGGLDPEYTWEARGPEFIKIIEMVWPWLSNKKRLAAANVLKEIS